MVASQRPAVRSYRRRAATPVPANGMGEADASIGQFIPECQVGDNGGSEWGGAGVALWFQPVADPTVVRFGPWVQCVGTWDDRSWGWATAHTNGSIGIFVESWDLNGFKQEVTRVFGLAHEDFTTIDFASASSGEIRDAPSECCRYAEEDVQESLDCRSVVAWAKARFFGDEYHGIPWWKLRSRRVSAINRPSGTWRFFFLFPGTSLRFVPG